MTIRDCVIQLLESNNDISLVKITNWFNYQEPILYINDNKIINIQFYECVDPGVVEFYNSNNQLITKVKGFFSVE